MQMQITEITRDLGGLIRELKETQVQITDLSDTVQGVCKETIPMILEQITEIQKEIAKAHSDLATIYEKIRKLETEDEHLREEIRNLEKKMKQAVDGEVTQIENHMQEIINRMQKTEENITNLYQISDTMGDEIHSINENTLRYRYDEEGHILYLAPYKE